MQTLDQIKLEFYRQLKKADSTDKLEKLRVSYLGRKGQINRLFTDIKSVPPQKRKDYGRQLNLLKSEITEALTVVKNVKVEVKPLKIKTSIPPVTVHTQLGQIKLGHYHPITITERLINDLFSQLGFSIYEGPEIETDEFCFQRLNVPGNHPSRDMQDSIYISEPDTLLRTQTSSIEARLLSQQKPPFKAAFPGRVYRNEKVNKSNHFVFHQYQGVAVYKDASLKDLFGTIDRLFKTLYGPNVIVRYRCKYYPEVEPGAGIDMQCFSCHGKGCPLCKGAGWIEMGGAGIIHPNVMKMAGIDPAKWRGFAFGLGLDRWTMAKFNIKDIRTLLGGNLAYKPYQL